MKQFKSKTIYGETNRCKSGDLSMLRHSCVVRDLPIFSSHKTFCMHNTKRSTQKQLQDKQLVAEIQSLHSEAHKTRVIRLYKRSFGQLVEDFIVEMDAKNRAYYFIMQSGYLQEFEEYCNGGQRA